VNQFACEKNILKIKENTFPVYYQKRKETFYINPLVCYGKGVSLTLIFEELVVGHEQYITFAFTPTSLVQVRRFPSSHSAAVALWNFFSSDLTHGLARCGLCSADLIHRQFPRTSHRPKLRIFIGLALLAESERA